MQKVAEVVKEREIILTQQVEQASLRAATDQEEWRSICGFRRDMVQGREGFGPSFHLLRIFESRKHRHHRQSEFCVGIKGKGSIILEDKAVPVSPGDVVVVPPMTWHTYRTDPHDPLHLMIIVNPGMMADEHDIEFWGETHASV